MPPSTRRNSFGSFAAPNSASPCQKGTTESAVPCATNTGRVPLLTLYANALGILGGMAVALGLLEISPMAYWIEMLTIVDLSDLVVGVIKGATFGFIVGLAGCLRGLQAERSAVGVGQAATSAVVTAILLIIIADAIFAVIFNILGW